ncbi:7-carboxy-7-deazaguanine synthase QueE [Calditerrivibrio nitroreducens]|uniref:7-carboxy-7-deazaguanine synthase n=1 Tax=Calditerrivibrio nitroreducens (strain DSM 19672 / NBRC 101217 / Yu37-1) TaxID=768670 RepID=E4TF30_CALNY|nr:7-carboxy-7-deazaguanine synthase QueE [Calditerrivibrio nitroreducens]ADR19470.1 Radical SAM domain protein [Calditerrivibrio nitroreducens DSM 19672]
MPLLNTSSEGFIKEVFTSIQGEGKYVGALQLFVRFSGCSIGCKGCDTDYSFTDSFDFNGTSVLSNPIKPERLACIIYDHIKPNSIHSISITGGEPLLQKDFLKELIFYLKGYGYRIFLETSGFFIDRLNEVGDMVDIISLDFKLGESFGVEFSLDEIRKIKDEIKNKIYIKIVIKNNLDFVVGRKILDGLALLNKTEFYLHFYDNCIKINQGIMDYFYSNGVDVFYVPQLHKLLEIK